MDADAHYRQKEKARCGDLKWCSHCHAFHHAGSCPCANKIAALETKITERDAKIAELRGLLAEMSTEHEQADQVVSGRVVKAI